MSEIHKLREFSILSIPSKDPLKNWKSIFEVIILDIKFKTLEIYVHTPLKILVPENLKYKE